MGKRRKCRYTPEELAIHEEAVRLRKMTDRQLVTEFHRAAEQETSLNVPDVSSGPSESEEAKETTSDIEKLLNGLSEGKVKGIKGATAYKIVQFAEELGLI